jgi:hypothetical protein
VLLTRSPLEYPRKGLSVRLACVKHAASVRPEPESNSPNKNQPTPQKAQTEFESEKPDHQQKDTKNWHQKNKKQSHTPTREVKMQPKTTTKQNHQTHY